MNPFCCSGSCWVRAGLLAMAICLPSAAPGADLSAQFDAANKLYEQGEYRQAAAAYQTLLEKHPASPTLHFNLGNAFFKAGDLGRAIAAYRRAQIGQPRDPAIRFNLAFARKQLVGMPPPPRAAWESAVTSLTLNEWTMLAIALYWVWMTLLLLRELFPAKRALRPYAITAGVAFLMSIAGLALFVYRDRNVAEAVVIASTASVRYGPLSESQTQFQLRDGTEVRIRGHKQLEDESWFRIEDSTGREGWVAELDLLRLPRAGS